MIPEKEKRLKPFIFSISYNPTVAIAYIRTVNTGPPSRTIGRKSAKATAPVIILVFNLFLPP